MLYDCLNPNRNEDDLFVVQAGLPGAMAKSARDRFNQAVLPIGETIGDASEDLAEVLDNEEFKEIIATLGVGIRLVEFEPFEDLFHLDRIRYGKIIVATDESPEGRYVRAQVLSLLHRFMSPVVEGGYVYTSSVGDLAGMTESEFARTVMAPDTRTIVQVVMNLDGMPE